MNPHLMPLDHRTRPLSPFPRAALALEVFLSVGALAGGLALMFGPRGEIVLLPVVAIRGSPFETYFVPGLILFGVLGIGPIVAARLILLRHPLAPAAVLLVGVGLIVLSRTASG